MKSLIKRNLLQKKEENKMTENNLLTVSEMANLLKISRSKAYDLVKNTTLPIIKIGKCIRIDKNVLFNWLHI